MNSQLFVEEDDEVHSETEVHETMDVEDDPIVDSIPLYINTVPNEATQSLHIIQYPGRPKARTLHEDVYRAAIKADSRYLEVKLPLDTSKFFNGGKVDDWGTDIDSQGLQGVLNDTGGGLYVGQIVGEGDDRKFVLVPVDSTTQLRPSFKYLDELDNLTQNQRRAEYAENNKANQIQILQTSAKSGSQITNSEGFGNALGESLKHIKKFEEEEWSHLKWNGAHEDATREIKNGLLHGADDVELSTSTTMNQYIVDLLE